MAWITVTIGLLAAYGASLSTFLVLTPYLRNRRHLAVTLTLGYLNQASALSEPMLILSASNRGQKTVVVSATGLRLPHRGRLLFLRAEGEVSLPHTLTSGKSIRLWISAARVAKALKEAGASGKPRISGIFTDELEHTYTSRGFAFDRDAYETAVPESVPVSVNVPQTISTPVAPETAPVFKW